MLDEIEYPTRGDGYGQILIGGLLSVLGSILIIPGILGLGYLVRVMESTVHGERTPPEFDDWGSLFVDGLVVIVLVLAYAFVPFVILFGGIYAVVAVGVVAGTELFAVTTALIGLALMIPLAFVVNYILPAPLVFYAGERRIGAAFDPGALKQVVLSGEYLKATAIVFAVVIGLQLVTFLVGITIVGLVLVPFISFAGQMVVARMYGLAVLSVAQ